MVDLKDMQNVALKQSSLGAPEDFDRHINSQGTNWNKIIKTENIHVDGTPFGQAWKCRTGLFPR